MDDYSVVKSFENKGYRVLYWFDDEGRPHRENDKPAVVKVDLQNRVLEQTWYKHGMEHRGYGRPSFIGEDGSERYVNEGRPYDIDRSLKGLYDYFDKNGWDAGRKKQVYDLLIDRYFLETAIRKEQVVEYAQARLAQINTTQACHAMKYVDKNSIQETTAGKPDVVFRFDEGSKEPLNNNTTPRERPGKVHNYVIVFAPDSHIEFLAMNLVEIRSKHAHILLSKFAPRFPDFKYLISGECIYDPATKKLSLNIQSGMNYQLNLSRFTPDDIERLRQRMKTDIQTGAVNFAPGTEDYGYVMLNDLMQGRGPKHDLFGAVSAVYFNQVLGFAIDQYSTSTFRGLTKESLDVVKSWCSQGVTIDTFADKKTCETKPSSGKSFCGQEPANEPVMEELETEEIEDYNSYTVVELKDMLDELGIVYPPRARKSQLIDLLIEYDESAESSSQ